MTSKWYKKEGDKLVVTENILISGPSHIFTDLSDWDVRPQKIPNFWPYKYHSTDKVGLVYLPTHSSIHVKEGYSWDGATFPVKFIRDWINTPDTWTASLVHDILTGAVHDEGWISDEECPTIDSIFLDILLQDTSRFKAYVMYAGVKVFGGVYFKWLRRWL